MQPPIDLTGQEFPRGTVIGYAGERKTKSGYKCHLWICKCACGRTRKINERALTKKSKQCRYCVGKLNHFIHGGKKDGKPTREYVSWRQMRTKFSDEDMVERWRGPDSFPTFLADMGPKPSKYYRLHRLDKTKPFGPDNCIWIKHGGPQKTYLFEGQRYTVGELAFIFEFNRDTLAGRLKTMSVEAAVSAPLGHNSHARTRIPDSPQLAQE